MMSFAEPKPVLCSLGKERGSVQISSIMAENIRKRDIGAAFGAKPAAEVRLTASCFVSELNLKRLSNMYSSLNSGFII